MNPRKDMIQYKLWLTKEEEESLKEALEHRDDEDADDTILEIIQHAFKRGDLSK